MITLDQIYFRLYNTYGKQDWWPAHSDIEMMLGAVLVQNTNWTNVEKSLRNFADFKAETINKMSLEELALCIKPSGFYTRKAQTIQVLIEWYARYNFEPSNLERMDTHEIRSELLSLKGIGPETCDCILLYGFNRPVFVVDTSLKRLLAKTGHPEMSTYQEIQTYMMNHLPKSVPLFKEYHAFVVAYGKQYSKSVEINDSDPLYNPLPTIPYTLNQLHCICERGPLSQIINDVGYVERTHFPDPFLGTIYAIIGQLISAAAADTISKRFFTRFTTEKELSEATVESLKSVGLTQSKARYIFDLMRKIENESFCFDTITTMSDQDAIEYLCSLKGIGVWSAKIILIHSYNRLNLDIYEDIALRNSVIKILGTETVSKVEFETYFAQFKPYKTIACFYHWRYSAKNR